MSCYWLERITKNKTFPLDSVVDAAFILTMENSDRHAHIYNHMIPNIPVSNIYIQFNRGFKKCKKEMIVQNVANDVVHAYKNIFRISNENNFKYVMILEDDAVFSDRIQNVHVQNDIASFLSERPVSCYNFGPCPYLPNPLHLLNTHRHNWISLSAHCCVYHSSFFKYLLNAELSNQTRVIFDNWMTNVIAFDDITSRSLQCYSYKYPLVYQEYFTKDSNSQNKLGYYLHKAIFFDGMKNGFDRMYLIGDAFALFLLFSIVYTIYILK
jgi:hypothetical protein